MCRCYRGPHFHIGSGAIITRTTLQSFQPPFTDRLISVHVHLLNTLNGEISTISILVQRLNCTRSGDFRMIDNWLDFLLCPSSVYRITGPTGNGKSHVSWSFLLFVYLIHPKFLKSCSSSRSRRPDCSNYKSRNLQRSIVFTRHAWTWTDEVDRWLSEKIVSKNFFPVGFRTQKVHK